MRNRIIDVIPPYEDEVLLSWIVRMLKLHGNMHFSNSTVEIMRDLFGPDTTKLPGFYYQKGLEWFVEKSNLEKSKYFSSKEAMINLMTVLPFYFPFLEEQFVRECLNEVDNDSYYIRLEEKIGVRDGAAYLEKGAFIKFCPDCLKESSSVYLKREHQIQGNYVCWKHGTVLKRVPYKLLWKNIDFISCIQREENIFPFYLEPVSYEIAKALALMIHSIFEDGFHSDRKELKKKLNCKLYELNYIQENGVFYDLDSFCDFLNVSYIYNVRTDLKKCICQAVGDTQNHPNPIIYLILIYRLFGSLDSYYHYELPTTLIKTLSKSRIALKNTDIVKHDILYYVKYHNKEFFQEYAILGDTENDIIVKHLVCGRCYRVSKKMSKLRSCRYCVGTDNSLVTGQFERKNIQYQRYLCSEEYADLHNKKEKQIRNYCKDNRIEGVLQVGGDYLIPKDAAYPEDRRYKSKKI